MSDTAPLTLQTLQDDLKESMLLPQQRVALQTYDCGFYRRLTQAATVVAAAQDAHYPIYLGVRHYIRERFGAFDLAALERVVDWLVAVHGLSASQAESIPLAELLPLLRTGTGAATNGPANDEKHNREPAGEATSETTGASKGGGPAKQASDKNASNVLWRDGEVWHLHYCGEKGDFPVKGNKCLTWLVKLLSKPNYAWTVAALYGDPDGKLAADALLRGENEKDNETLRKIAERIEEIETFSEGTGGSETLEQEHATLLKELEQHTAHKRLDTPLHRAYNNISTQFRQFRLNKLAKVMPQLAAHLEASLKPDGSSFTLSYRPAAGTPNWIVDNPSA
jgi:hypothetical protein